MDRSFSAERVPTVVYSKTAKWCKAAATASHSHVCGGDSVNVSVTSAQFLRVRLIQYVDLAMYEKRTVLASASALSAKLTLRLPNLDQCSMQSRALRVSHFFEASSFK